VKERKERKRRGQIGRREEEEVVVRSRMEGRKEEKGRRIKTREVKVSL